MNRSFRKGRHSIIHRISTHHVVLLLLLATAITSCKKSPTDAPPVAPRIIRVGAIYNLTGAQASLDGPSAMGARLASALLNGVDNTTVLFTLRDGKSDTAVIAAAARELITADSVDILIGFSDTDMLAPAVRVAAQYKVVVITSGATSPKAPALASGLVFLSCFGDNTQAAIGAEMLYYALKAKTAYLLYDNSMLYTRLLAGYFKQRYAEVAGAIVGEDRYTAGTTDYSVNIAHFKSLTPAPEALYIAAGPDDCGAIVRQFREAGITQPIFGGDAFDTPLLSQTAGVLSDNVYFTTHAFVTDTSSNPLMHDFAAKYRADYGGAANAFAALGYDACALAVDAVRRAGSGDPAALRGVLFATRNFPAVTGNLTYAPYSYIPLKAVTVVRMIGGNPTLFSVQTPTRVPYP